MTDRIYNRTAVRERPGSLRCAFTGHRPQKMPFGFDEADARCLSFKRRLAEAVGGLVREGYTHFLSGGAMGTDIWAAEAVLLLRYRHPEILLEMVSPFDSQAARWSEEHRARHDRLFALADIVTATGHAFSPGCLQRRNRYLVDNADLLLAATLGVRGGTEQTVAYARRAGVPVRYLEMGEAKGETAEKEEKTGAS